LDEAPDYIAVELILTLCIPRRDVKSVAKDLVRRFGSYRAVIDASENELASVPGVGSATAGKLQLVRMAAVHYLKQHATEVPVPRDSDAVNDYVRARLGPLHTEEFWVLCLDATLRVIHDEAVAQGTVNRTAVFPRQVVNTALRREAAAIVLAHNHPSGVAAPSEEDKALTRQIALAASAVDIRLYDHIIVGLDEVYSFRASGLL
jgi:DNA repair protein RadC